MRTLTVLGLALWIFGCGVGNGVSAVESRQLGDIHTVEATQGVVVTVRYGEPATLTLETDENLMAMVETSQRNGVLHVGIVRNQWAFASNGVKVTVVTPRLDAAKATSTAAVRVEGAAQPEFRAEATSNASIELVDLRLQRLSAEVTSGATLTATGTVEFLDASSTSSATLNAGELEAREVTLEATSLARASVKATSMIKGTVTSGASILVRGHPAQKDLEVTSGGAVRYQE